MNQAVIMLRDMQLDIAYAQPFLQTQEGVANVQGALLHLSTAELLLRRTLRLEEAAHVPLFDIEQDISDQREQ